ncbi:hypothetical protein [Streptomyces glaucus]|uniref:Uncharacterized protein n=1 Tax=Streptomyces glaucus TaxID=284029 RepID=A0ABN3JNY2_9ACTN
MPGPRLHEALRTARRQGTAAIRFTERTGQDGRTGRREAVPGYWDDIVSRVGTGVSE